MDERFTWVPLSLRKNIDLPSVTYKNLTECAGYYTSGTKDLIISTNCWYPKATIAHEFKHYIDYTNGVTLDGFGIHLFKKYSYNKAIRLYFRARNYELAALLFEYKYARTPLNEFWLKALVLPDTDKFNEHETFY